MYFLAKYSRGVFNRYHKGMPWPEMLAKDATSAWQIVTAPKGAHKILCYPHFPSRRSTIYKIARLLRCVVTNRLDRRVDLALYYEYATHRTESQWMHGMEGIRIINRESVNISKDFVDEHMTRAFGYGTTIDPARHRGTAVRKSLLNGLHDGEVVQCPVDARAGFIHQRLIDNDFGPDLVRDIRVPVVAGDVPFVYLKYRKRTERFRNTAVRAELIQGVGSVLSASELQAVRQVAVAVHLDFGELDVLRDNGDQRIYVVDINNTPQGPPRGISATDGKLAIRLLAEAFSRAFLSPG